MMMGSSAVVMAVAITLVIETLLNGAESVICGDEDPAPWADAATLVNQLRLNTGQCCNPGACTVVSTLGDAAASLCGPPGWCPNCSDVGNGLNEVLAQCNVANFVCGSYWTDVSGAGGYYHLTNVAGAAQLY